MFANIEEARKFFSGDRFATGNGITLEELDETRSVASLAVADGHRNAIGGVMGGAIFTLADFAFAALVNDASRATVAQQVSINYLNPPKCEKLVATAQYVKDGRSSCVVRIEIVDGCSRPVATATALGFKIAKKA